MSQAEQASDSDSNTSSSWIFLDDSPSENQPSKSDDYPKYIDESVLDLISTSSNSANLEQETDSDGISIISEGDDMKEIQQSEDIPLPAEIEDVQGQAPLQQIVVDKKNEVYFNKYIVVSWIVLAVLTPLVLNYFTTTHTKDVEDVVVKATHMDAPNKNVLQGKRKYDSKGESDEHRLDCKEHNCASLQLSSARKADLAQLENQISQQDDSSKALKKIKNAKDENNRIKSKNKKKELVKTNEFSKKKNEGTKRQKKKKSKKGKDENTEKEIKHLKKKLNEKDKEIKDLSRLLKIKDKHLKMLEYKVLKHLNALTKGKNNDEVMRDVGEIKSTLKKVNGTSGEWYSKLYKGRTRIRSQQHMSDWIFDRAAFRSKKRNIKNNWYWNWMTNREQLRLKRGFWHFTY